MKPVLLRSCVECGASFETRRAVKVCCTKRCSKANYQKRHLEEARVANRASYHRHWDARAAKRNTAEAKAKAKAFSQAYRAAHLDRLRQAGREYGALNRDKKIAYMREYNKRPETKQRMEQFRRRHADRLARLRVAFRASHPDYMHTRGAIRRARLAGVPHEVISRTIVFERAGYRCQICDVPTPIELRGTMLPTAPEVDHVVPLSRGGSHTYDNVQLACRRCNVLKRARTMDEFRPLPIEAYRSSSPESPREPME